MSGDLEYTTEETSDYTSKEPVQFQSSWLQNLTDVKSLADWIKDTVVNRGKVVSMDVFGNPLISVGDLVTIKYSYQGFAGTEKSIGLMFCVYIIADVPLESNSITLSPIF